MKTFVRGKRLIASTAGGLVVLGATAVIASGAYPGSNVQVYTGCLSTAGLVTNVASSPSTPLKACAKNDTVVHLSGGTITSVTAGTGLAGGSSDGAVSVSLGSSYQLPQGCSNGQVAASDGSNNWTCATASSGGGLAGQSCPAHQFVTGVDATGTISCAQPSPNDVTGGSCSWHATPGTWVAAAGTPRFVVTCEWAAGVTLTGGETIFAFIDNPSLTGGEVDSTTSDSVLVDPGQSTTITLNARNSFSFTCPADTTGGQAAEGPISGPGTYTSYPFSPRSGLTLYAGSCTADAGIPSGPYTVTASG